MRPVKLIMSAFGSYAGEEIVDFSKLNISKMELFNKMREKNIGLQLHYIPINKQPYYKSLGYGNEDTPIMNKYYDECFSLPMYSSLSNEEQEYVIKTLFEILIILELCLEQFLADHQIQLQPLKLGIHL